MLQLNAEELKTRIQEFDDFQIAGQVFSYHGLLRANLAASVGDLCKIAEPGRPTVLAEVIGFEEGATLLLPMHRIESLSPGANIIGLKRSMHVPVGHKLKGRVLNGLCQPIDSRGPLVASQWIGNEPWTPDPMDRPPINEVFETGQRAIDGMLTIGKGQRVGLFAGSGIGKSTLLGEISKRSSSDINVIALIGERGREVQPFIEECLGEDGLARSVVIVATADETPLMRLHAAKSAIAIANWFRQQRHDVLFIIDSLTRLAFAQRELGLLLGEPPTSRGYPPSSLQLMADLMEPLGRTQEGSITGILSVLVDGDDMNEPVADTVRSVIDGHIVLTRKLAEQNHYPAIDIGHSISRLADSIVSDPHRRATQKIRSVLSTYQEVEDLIRIGMYQAGTSEKIDTAIMLREHINQFLRQLNGEHARFADSVSRMTQMMDTWSY